MRALGAEASETPRTLVSCPGKKLSTGVHDLIIPGTVATPGRTLHDFLLYPSYLWLFVFLCFTALNVNGRDLADARPRIGVALEGGGALGLAHIGVLEWFEEHRIPVDYIAGTSMGGLVGGIYATGRPAAEIHKIALGFDWDAILSGRPAFQDLAYRRKEDLRDFQNYVEFGLRHGFKGPSGINSGQEVTFILDRLAVPYFAGSFDDLPIPFRCVATDLITGRPFVFKEGPLGEALRSTMSLPAVFTPLERDGRIYADGGLLNNLPVDIVKQMGADIVIAVNLKGSPFKPENAQSLLSVMGRSISVMIAANEVHNAELADILISADLADYTSTSYKAGEQIIHQGYEGAARKASLLSRLALDQSAWDLLLQARESRRRSAPPAPQFVDVKGLDEPSAKDVRDKLADQIGAPVDTKKLERDLNLLAGSRRFSSFSYHAARQGEEQGLAIHADETSYAPPFVKLGILIDGAEYDNVLFTGKVRITRLDLGGFGSEWRTDFTFGSQWGIESEYYKPLARESRWFLAPRVYAQDTPFNLYDRSIQLADYRIRQYGTGVDLGYAFNRFSELRLGYEISDYRSSLRVGAPVLPTPHGRVGISSVRYNLDKLDSPIVPRQGEAVRSRVQWTDASPGAPRAFPLAELYLVGVHRTSKAGSVFVQAYGGSTFGHQDTGLPQFYLGGPGILSAYGEHELRTNQYYLLRAGYIRELANLPPLIGNKIYLISAYELGKTYGLPPSSTLSLSSRLPTDGTVALVIDTLFGPLSIGGSAGDTGHYKWYFSLGKVF